MNKIFYRGIVLFILLIPMFIYGASDPVKCEISGVVQDDKSGEGLPFASIQILLLSDSSIVKGAMTDVNGNYRIGNIKADEYIVMASYMGYNEKVKNLNLQKRKMRCDFHLIQKSIALSEVSVSAEKKLVENTIEKTTINVSKNNVLSGGTAMDVMQTLPSVDIDIDGKINYRGSNKVIILINGEKSELVKSMDQIPAGQIEKVELINNPSVKYEAEGMSGIINIVLKSGTPGKKKTTLMFSAGYPETLGGNAGYSRMSNKSSFFINAGIKHKTNFQTKEHLRENYENPNADNYYQFDRQDKNLNDAFLNTNFSYSIGRNQKIGISLMGSKKFDDATRSIKYDVQDQAGVKLDESKKEIDIDLDNYTIDGKLNYRYNFKKKRFMSAKLHYSVLDQMQEMNNEFYPDLTLANPELQNTYSKQLNKKTNLALDYSHPFNDSVRLETGYNFSSKDLLNDFSSESYNSSGEWISDTALNNKFNYVQNIHAVYLNFTSKLRYFELQAGLRGEYTSNEQNNAQKDNYIDIFPSISISGKLNNHFTLYAGYNRRINRPTIKMLNPFSDEYADVLNMHKGNPSLKPEYVNSVEMGSRFVYDKFSGLISVYYRHINKAISRIKSATNDSALMVTFMNLDKAELIGGEISLSYKPFKWWNVNASSNIFHTHLTGDYGSNQIDNSKTAWNLNLSNHLKLAKGFGFQLSGYYRSKLPSVMGIYKERYYFDLALNKHIMKNKAQLIFKISDVFNTYKFGLDLDAIDENGYRYSQRNRRKNESQYFILSFIYNINGKKQEPKKQKGNFFLNDFDK